jgi:hypothetical protein
VAPSVLSKINRLAMLDCQRLTGPTRSWIDVL